MKFPPPSAFAKALMIILVMLTHPLAAEPLGVVASFSILGDLVREVGGARVAVTTLVGANGDAHVFEPTPNDARAIKSARLVVVNGLGLEGWMSRLIQSTGYRGPVVVASAGVMPRQGEGIGIDPHAWQNVNNVVRYVDNIVGALADIDPDHAADYRNNGLRYSAELGALDRSVRTAFSAIPADKRKVITSHEAFGYFGEAYGLSLLAPEGFSTDAEPTAQGVAALIRQIRRTGIKAIFIENMSDPRLIRQIAREAGATVGGQLFSDALSAADGPAATYVAMIKHNTATLVETLRPDAR